MTDQHYLNDYQRGLEFAEAGDYTKALECIYRYLNENPVDAEALNDAGVILHCMNNDAEAITCLLRARSVRPDDVQMLMNLTESYLGNGNIEEFVGLISELEAANLLNPELLNRAANMALEQSKNDLAIDMLLRSNKLWPGQKVIEPMIEVIKGKMPKIGFISSVRLNQTDFGGIYGYLKERYRCHFYNTEDGLKFSDLKGDEDVVWLYNCPEFAADITCFTGNYKVVLDLSNTILTDNVSSKINWDNIDIIFTKEDLALPPSVNHKVVKLNYGINVFGSCVNSKPQGKNIVCLDRIDAMSNSMMLVQCMQKLNYIDPEYKLYLAGGCSSAAVEKYMRSMINRLNLQNVVSIINPTSQTDDLISDKHFVVSCSVDNAGVENVLYGMWAGLKPVVHYFDGSEELFGHEYVFNIAEDFCRIVTDPTYAPQMYHNNVATATCNNNKFEVIQNKLAQLAQPSMAGQAQGVTNNLSFNTTVFGS